MSICTRNQAPQSAINKPDDGTEPTVRKHAAVYVIPNILMHSATALACSDVFLYSPKTCHATILRNALKRPTKCLAISVKKYIEESST